MTPELSQHLASTLGVPQAQLSAQAVHGGDINQAYRLTDGQQFWFVKVNKSVHLSVFEAEQRGLELIRSSNAIRVPEALGVGTLAGQCYLLLEYIQLRGQPQSEKLALALAAMHRFTGEAFGNERNNTIGLTPQQNTWESSWVDFWSAHRLGFQLALGRDRGLDNHLLNRLQELQGHLPAFFTSYQPRPSLLHGDLWSGNWSADPDGNPVIYDPACYFGDHEADLAMMELFGNPGDRFFDVYREQFPIDDGYRQRKQLYNLYHIVNHALLFGGGYAAQAGRMTDRLLAELT